MRVCPRCKTPSTIRSRTRWFERPIQALTPARLYRCPACGRRFWARPSSAHAKGRTTVEPDSVVADRGGQEPGRRMEDEDRIIPADSFAPQTAIDDEEPALGVTIKDVVKLSREGVGEAVLVELIEMADVEQPLMRAPLRVPKLSALKRAGVSDQVLLALLRHGRSADGDKLAGAHRIQRSEDESSERLRQEDAHNVPAGRHGHRTGARVRARGKRADARN